MAKVQSNNRIAAYYTNEQGERVGKAFATVYITENVSREDAFAAVCESVAEAREKAQTTLTTIVEQIVKNDGSILSTTPLGDVKDEDFELEVAAIEAQDDANVTAQEVTSDCRMCGAVAMTSKAGYDHCAACGYIPEAEIERLEIEAEEQYDREYGKTDEASDDDDDEIAAIDEEINDNLARIIATPVAKGDDEGLRRRAEARAALKARTTKAAKTPRVLKQYDTNNEKGLIYTTKSRATGAVIKLWHVAQAGLSFSEPYALECVTHSVYKSMPERRLGRDNMGDPFYCEQCVAIAQEKGITLQERTEKYRGPKH